MVALLRLPRSEMERANQEDGASLTLNNNLWRQGAGREESRIYLSLFRRRSQRMGLRTKRPAPSLQSQATIPSEL